MNFKKLAMNNKLMLDSIAQRLLDLVKRAPKIEPIETENFGWINHRFSSSLFRMAHVERYSDSKIEVLHFTIFPHKWSPEPIFGFDVITTEKMITGCYMDLSPGLNQYPEVMMCKFDDRKPIPEWATVFSDDFIMLKPKSEEEFHRFVDWVYDKCDWYLNSLLWLEKKGDESLIIEKQNTYCKIQATNPRTFSALKAMIGEEKARYFMENILFPKI
jgi:hypothetical protein